MKRSPRHCLTGLLCQENYPGFKMKIMEDKNLKTLMDVKEEYKQQTAGIKGVAEG